MQQVSLVINFHLPPKSGEFLAQGWPRWKGVAVIFGTNSDVGFTKNIERYYHLRVEEIPLDTVDWI